MWKKSSNSSLLSEVPWVKQRMRKSSVHSSEQQRRRLPSQRPISMRYESSWKRYASPLHFRKRHRSVSFSYIPSENASTSMRLFSNVDPDQVSVPVRVNSCSLTSLATPVLVSFAWVSQDVSHDWVAMPDCVVPEECIDVSMSPPVLQAVNTNKSMNHTTYLCIERYRLGIQKIVSEIWINQNIFAFSYEIYTIELVKANLLFPYFTWSVRSQYRSVYIDTGEKGRYFFLTFFHLSP